MAGHRTTALVLTTAALATGVLLGACASTGATTPGAPSPHTSAAAGPASSPAGAGSSGCADPWRSWGPGMLGSPGVAGTGGMMRNGGMMGGTGTPGQDGWTWGPGMMNGSDYWLPGNGTPVHTLDQARQRATAFADRLGLRVGDVMQFTCNFYAELITSAGPRATEVLVNPADGAVEIEYGPAMMWNTRYGMHATGGPTGTATMSATRARTTAQHWLDNHEAGLTTGDVDPYPGYYTVDVLHDGRFTGMMSVNAYTGAVWNHTWHGTWIATSTG